MQKYKTIKKKITTQKVLKKNTRVRKKISLRDKNFQLEGLIELKNSFNKKKVRVKL